MKKTKITPKRIPRGKSGGRKKTYTDQSKPTQANLYIPAEELEAFCALVPATADRNRLVTQWVRAYTIAHGETDRLLAQSPLSLRLLNYLEAIGTPESEDYAEELLSLIVARESDEAKLVDGAIELKGDSYIV